MSSLFYTKKNNHSIATPRIAPAIKTNGTTVFFSLVALLLLPALTANAQFTAGNIAVFVAASASANNTTGSIVELTNSATGQTGTIYSIPGITGANLLRFSGSATSTCYMANSNDGTLLCFNGANSTNTSSNVNTLNPRGVGTFNPSGIYSLATTYTGSSGNQTRCATSLDNSTWFIADQGGIYSNGNTGASPSGNFRGIKAFGGIVYVGQQSSTAIEVSTLSAAVGGTVTALPGIPFNNSFQDFYLISSGSNGSSYDILYILSSTSATAGTINKYSLVNGTWVANGSFTTTFGGFGLCAQSQSGNVYLFASTGTGATSNNSVIRLSDMAGYNASININSVNNITLYTATGGAIVKGVALAPVGSCTPISIITQPTSPAAVCSGSGTAAFTVSVGGTAPFSYQWQENSTNISDGGIYSGTNTQTLTITNPGVSSNGNTYRCIISNCSGLNSQTTDNTATLTVLNAPNVQVSASEDTICSGDSVTLTASGADSYSWQPGGATSTSIKVAPSSNTTYTVTGTASGYPPTCSSTSASKTIQVNNIPDEPGDFTASSSTVSQGQTNVLYTVPNVTGVTYTWSYSGTGATINGSGNSVTINFSLSATGGTLSVTASNSCGTGTARTLAISVLTPSGFTPGNLVVLQTSGTISKASSAITLKEYAPDGTPGISVSLPITGVNPIQTSGVFGGSEGFLTTSTDNKYICLGGFGTSASFADVTATASSAVSRVTGTVAPSGFYLQTGSSNVFYSGNDIRGSVSDGANSWASGASVSNVDGIDYYGPGAQAGLGTGSSPPKAYGLRIFNGQIFYSTQKSGPNNSSSQLGIFSLNGSPTSNPVTITQVINTGTIIPEDFSFSPNLDTCYIAVNLNTSSGGIQKWVKGSVWSLAYTLGTGIANTGAYGLVVDYSGAHPVIYATTFDAAGNRVIKITDTGAGSIATTIVTASSNVFYKGICFAPVASGTPVVNLTVSSDTASEAGKTAITVTANASFSVVGDQTVSLHVSGTGITAGDYSLSDTTITIPNGSAGGSVTFTVKDDSIYEGLETAVLTIGNSTSGITLGSNTSQSISIRDNDLQNNPPTISMNVSTTTNYIDGGVTTSPTSPFTASGVISDPIDPLSAYGIDFLVKDAETSSDSLIVTASSSNPAVVPQTNVTVSGSDSIRNVKINPVGVGYSTITVSVSDGVNTSTYIINYAASAASATPYTTLWHTGMSDASDAIRLDDNYYVSGDDELDVLNVYSRTASGLDVESYNYAAYLNLPDPGKPEVDVEAATRSTTSDTTVYWMGSMSNGKDPFPNEPNRDRLFATTVTGTGATTSFSVLGYGAIKTSLIAWGDANGYDFSASAASGVDSKTTSGFAAEGMVFGPDNTTLYIGMRAPLVPTSNRTKAVIAPILNFETWFNNGHPAGDPTYGSPIELDLGARGIRDLIRLSNGTYIILAGDPGEIMDGELYKWTGNPNDAPILVNCSIASSLNMEGALQINVNGNLSLSQLQVISDGGDVILYNDGNEAKDFGDLILRKFRSDSLSGLDLCLPTSGDTTVIACNSFTWHGVTYTSTPDTLPIHILTNAGGCDSTVRLHLTINQGIVYYADADGDGFGDTTNSINACVQPAGYVTNGSDCNDADANAWRTGTFYIDQDGDGYDAGTASICYGAIIPSGYSATTLGTDCNDGDANKFVNGSFYVDADGDGYGTGSLVSVCYNGQGTPSGYSTNNTDCNDNSAAINPGAQEVCNNIDDNCNGQIDEGVTTTFYADADGDAYGNPLVSVHACSAPPGYVTDNTDCNDSNAAVHPGAVEILNGIDDNCNGLIDEGTCAVPIGLSVTNLTATTAKLNWGAVTSATKYKLQYTPAKSNNWTTIVVKSTQLSYTIAGLTPGTKYKWRISATCKDVKSDFSPVQKFTTHSSRTEDGSQSTLASKLSIYPNPTAGSFTLALQLSDGSTGKAQIQVMSLLGQVIYQKTETVSGGMLSTQISLSDALPSGNYLVRVVAAEQEFSKMITLQR